MSLQYDTKTLSFRQIVGNGLRYNVPRFQRDYSWGEEQWDDLWQDILEQDTQSNQKKLIPNKEDHSHYMGYVVLKSEDNKTFTVVDGQQRLTTISIIILAGLSHLQKLIDEGKSVDKNKQRKKTLFSSFIGFVDPVNLSTNNKMTLNQNNNLYFSNYLCQFKPAPIRNINASERLMGKAYEYFIDRIKDNKNLIDGESIAQFIETLVDNLIFTTITVGDETNAYCVFETLNARGVKLSTPDLIKNYIFSLIDDSGTFHETELKKLEDRWVEIVKQLGKLPFSDFIRVDWNSRNELTRKINLFKKIKSKLDSKDKADKYLDFLRQNAEVYSALRDRDDKFWREYKNGQYNDQKLLRGLEVLKVFSIKNAYSALMAAFHKFEAKDFLKFLSYVEVVCIRYNAIGGRSANTQEQIYSKITKAINSNDCSFKDVVYLFKPIYPNDEAFVNDFKQKTFLAAQTKKIHYFLARIENHINPEFELSNASALTVEHILPQNPTQDWLKDFEDKEIDDCIDSIANMTLLTKSSNLHAAQKSFQEKKQFYKESTINITKQVAEYTLWSKQDILDRQKYLAKYAKSIWKISSLS